MTMRKRYSQDKNAGTVRYRKDWHDVNVTVEQEGREIGLFAPPRQNDNWLPRHPLPREVFQADVVGLRFEKRGGGTYRAG